MRYSVNERNTYIALLQGRLSYNELILDRDSLYAFLYRHKLLTLSDSFLDSLEENERFFWIGILKKYSFQSLSLSRILITILKELQKQGIEAIPIKGPVLAKRLYGDVCKRHSGDLDLVIRKDDLLSVIKALKKLDYQLVSPKTELSSKQRDYYQKYKKEYCVFNKEVGLYVELHLGIYNHGLLRPSIGEIFLKEMVRGEIGGVSIREMNLNNAFLYLAYHGGHHQFHKLFWLRDIAEALKSWSLDHMLILSNARSMGIERLLVMSLYLANTIFGSIIPKEYRDYLNENNTIIEKMSHICVNIIFGPDRLSFKSKVQKLYFKLMLKSSINYKLMVVTNIIHRMYIRKFLGGI